MHTHKCCSFPEQTMTTEIMSILLFSFIQNPQSSPSPLSSTLSVTIHLPSLHSLSRCFLAANKHTNANNYFIVWFIFSRYTNSTKQITEVRQMLQKRSRSFRLIQSLKSGINQTRVCSHAGSSQAQRCFEINDNVSMLTCSQ